MHILLAHASVHGSTAEIARFMAQTLEADGFDVTLSYVEAVESLDSYDVVMPGAPIHGGMPVKPMLVFLHRFAGPLQRKLVFPWITCIRILEPDSYDHIVHNYLPVDVLHLPHLYGVGVFAGKLDIKTIDWEERWTLSLRYDGGEALERLAGDFRDWNKIRHWTEIVAEKLKHLCVPEV